MAKKRRLPKPEDGLPFIDTHCHFLERQPKNAKLPTPEEQYTAFFREGGLFVISSSLDYDSIGPIRKFNASHENTGLTCGWAPQTVTYSKPKEYERQWDLWSKFVVENPDEFLAIGEVGLDFHHARTLEAREKQVAELRKVFEVTEPLGKPYVLHVRNAAPHEVDGEHPDHTYNAADGANLTILELLEEFKVEPKRVAWHCFSGPEEYGKELAGRGFVLSVPSSAYGFYKWRKNTENVPLESLITETDAFYQHPYLRGPTNQPVNVRYSISAIAWSHRLPQREVAEATVANASEFFGLEL
ncbi:MAG: TatD family hydrolase [Promethearchaeota archaeon]